MNTHCVSFTHIASPQPLSGREGPLFLLLIFKSPAGGDLEGAKQAP
jgi:hypothetical protein